MEDEFNELSPAEPINPYAASSTPESYYTPPMSSGNGTIALWLGVISMIASVLGVICCIPFVFNLVGVVSGVVAVVLGVKEMRAVRAGYAHASNRTTAQIGVVFGSIGIGISLLLMLLFAGFIAFAILADPPS